jgi:hypothetical protein
MEIRIRTVFRPLTYSLAFTLDRLGISPTLLVWLSYITGVAGFIALYLLVDNPYSDGLVYAALLSIFLNGLSVETLYEFIARRAMVSELERLEFFFDKYTDIFIILGASIFVGDEKYGFIYLSRFSGLLLGALIVAGMVAHDVLSGKEGQKVRGERMFLLAISGYLGPRLDPTGHFNPFREYIFYGMLLLAAVLWISILDVLWKKSSFSRIPAPKIPVFPWRNYLTRMIGYAAGIKMPRRGVKVVPLGEEAGRVRNEVEEEVPAHNFTVLVAEEGTETGVIGAEVRLLNKETGKSVTLKTDPEGRMTFEDMPEGQYVVTVTAEGYTRQDFDRYISTDTGDLLYIKKAAQDLSVIVNDEVKMRPIPDALVSLLSKKTGSTLMRRTDNLGVAYFETLEKGRYSISAEAPGYDEGGGTVDLERENVFSVNLVPKEPEKLGVETRDLGDTALIEYTQGSGVEDIVVEMVQDLQTREKEVHFVCSPSKAGMYRRRLKDVRVITLPTEGAAPSDDEAIGEIPMTNLEYFRAVYDGMSKDGVLLFEPLSNLILNLGIDPAYKFVSHAVDYLSGKGLAFYAMINKEVHDRREVSSFENLFLNVFDVEKGRLKKLK